MNTQQQIPKLSILNCFNTIITFGDDQYEVIYCDNEITISHDSKNYVVVKLKNQQVPYKATILGGFAFSEEITGTIAYKQYFNINWEDEYSVPELAFKQKPTRIEREYEKGRKIELGIEDVSRYHVIYQDNVCADFTRTGDGDYDFHFSTGFYGSIHKETDDSHTIRFKGNRLDAEEDGYNSESKFIITRSKYTGNLLLILQDKAKVLLEH
ncbi:MAG: hypothetical protein GY950_15995 [bacterium]|nr:hypothetical protein [bacterium]